MIQPARPQSASAAYLDLKVCRYRLRRLIGEGLSGKVYEALDYTGSPMVVKWLRPEVASLPGIAERIRVHALSPPRLGHPALQDVLRIEHHGLDFLFAMDRAPGEPLDRFLQRRREVSAELLARQFSELLDTFHHAHQRGFVHANCKPGNLRVLHDGTFRALDFHMSRILGLSEATRHLLGCDDFSSPEQSLQGCADPRSDVYSLGMVLQQIVQLQVPAGAARERLEQVVQRAVEPDARLRFQSALDFSKALRATLTPRLTSPTASSDSPRNSPAVHVPSGTQQARLLRGQVPQPVGPPGVVRLEAVIGASGRVESLRAIAGAERLIESALMAVQTWVYEPARSGTEPSRVRTEIEIEFAAS